MSDSSDSSKPRPKTAAVPHYTVGEEIMNSVTPITSLSDTLLSMVSAACWVSRAWYS